MFHGLITNERHKNSLELVTHVSSFHNKNTNFTQKKSFENLVLCKSSSILDLPLNGENTLDVSKNGEYILASNKSHLCFINTRTDLYSTLGCQRNINKSCCCDSQSIKHSLLSSRQTLVKDLNYKKRCTSALWYSPDNMIFVTSGDTSIDIWDNTNREITYSFSNLPSLVNCMSIANTNTASPPVAGGLSCGTISMCDIRFGSATNLCKPNFSAGISVIKFLKDNENQLIAGYDNSSVLIWDLRKFNRPLHTISSSNSTKQESLIWGCSVNTGFKRSGSRVLVEKHSMHFNNEDEIWDYIKDHETDPDPKRRASNTSGRFKVDKDKDKEIMGVNDRRKVKLGDRKTEKRKKNYSLLEATDMMIANYVNKKSSEFNSEMVKERKDSPTDIKISDVDFNIYISHKNGFIDCYNSSTFKQIKSVDVNKFLRQFQGDHSPSRYSQKMKIQLICKDSFVMFNNMDFVGLINLKEGSLCKYIRIRVDETGGDSTQETSETPITMNPLIIEGFPRTTRALQGFESHLTYVTDISTIPSTREIYVANESGQLYVLHPDYKQLFKKTNNVK